MRERIARIIRTAIESPGARRRLASMPRIAGYLQLDLAAMRSRALFPAWLDVLAAIQIRLTP